MPEKINAPPEIETLLRKLACKTASGNCASATIVGEVDSAGNFTRNRGYMKLEPAANGKYTIRLTSKAIEEAIDDDPEVAQARQLTEAEDPFNYDVDGVVQPPWIYGILESLLVENTWHAACIETKACDYAYNRPLLYLRDGAKDIASADVLAAAKEEIFAFLKSCADGKPIEDLMRDVAMDFEALGCAAFELRRDGKGFVRALTHVPFADLRFLTKKKSDETGAKYLQKKYGKHVYYVGLNDFVTFLNKERKQFQPSIARDSEFPDYDKRGAHIQLTPPYVTYYTAEETNDRDEAANELFVLARSPFTKSRLYGTPSGISAYRAMLAQMKIDAYNLAFFSAQGIPQYAVVLKGLSPARESDVGDVDEDGVMTPAEMEKLRSTIKEYFKKELQAGNRSILVLTLTGDAEVTFERLSNERIEASFELYEKRCRDKIRVAHRVPSAALGIDIANTGIGGNRDQAQMRRYRDHIVTPGQRLLENVVNVILRCGLLIPYYDFKFAPMNLEEETEQRKFHLEEYVKGAITLDEYRLSRGWPALENERGNMLILRSTNLTIIDNNPEGTQQRIQDAIGYEKRLRRQLTGEAALDELDELDAELFGGKGEQDGEG